MLREPEIDPQGASGSGQPKKATVRRNVTTNYLVAIVLVAVGFITTPILTHQLGILRYGVWALIGALIPFLEILELGFASATTAFVSRHLELRDNDKVDATINTSLVILSILGIVAFAGVVVFAVFLPDIITSIPKSLVGQARFLLLLLAFDMALSIPMDTFGGTLVAMQRFDLLNYSLIAVIVAQAIGWVVVLSLHGGLIALGVVTVVVSELGQVSRVIMIHRLLPWFRVSLRKIRPQHRQEVHDRLGLVLTRTDLRRRPGAFRRAGRGCRRRGAGRRHLRGGPAARSAPAEGRAAPHGHPVREGRRAGGPGQLGGPAREPR